MACYQLWGRVDPPEPRNSPWVKVEAVDFSSPLTVLHAWLVASGYPEIRIYMTKKYLTFIVAFQSRYRPMALLRAGEYVLS